MENNINILVDKLIKASPKQLKKMLSLCDGPEDIIHQYEASKVPEYNIIQLLKRSYRVKELQWFLCDIFFAIAPESITDNVLQACINYPGRFKKTLLIQLAHIWLTERQLIELNTHIDTPEAFYKLFLMYLYQNDVPCEKLLQFLLNNRRHLNALIGYKERLPNANANEEKINMTDAVLAKSDIVEDLLH